MALTQFDDSEIYELAGYIKSMYSRLQNLHKISDELTRQVEKTNSSMKEKGSELKRELSIVQDEVSDLKQEVRFVQKAVVGFITQLKNSVKADEMERFKKRVDVWAPETFVTRKEVDKVIEES
jgi:flagellar capping protein FliD